MVLNISVILMTVGQFANFGHIIPSKHEEYVVHTKLVEKAG